MGREMEANEQITKRASSSDFRSSRLSHSSASLIDARDVTDLNRVYAGLTL
jgi:hypothetical protein